MRDCSGTYLHTSTVLSMGPATRSAQATSSKVTLEDVNGGADSEDGSPLTELSEREQPVESENKVGEGVAVIEVSYVKSDVYT